MYGRKLTIGSGIVLLGASLTLYAAEPPMAFRDDAVRLKTTRPTTAGQAEAFRVAQDLREPVPITTRDAHIQTFVQEQDSLLRQLPIQATPVDTAGYESSGRSAAGNNCSNPIVVAIPGDLPYADLDQRTCDRLDSYNGTTCLDPYDYGEDIIYRLDVTELTGVEIIMNPNGTQYSGMALGLDCPPETCIDAVGDSSSDPRTIVATLAPGSYFLIIDMTDAVLEYCIPFFDLTISAYQLPNGACCVASDCVATTNEYDCVNTYGGEWYEGEDCATFTCPEPPSGACCVATDCVATTTQSDCEDTHGGDWYEGEDCATFACPPPPDNDDCENALAITAPYPVTGSASTAHATVDCEGLLDWNGVWFEIELPYAENDVQVSYCPTNAEDIAVVAIILMDDCACDDYITADGGEQWDYDCDGYQGYDMVFSAVAGPGTILLPAYAADDANAGMDFEYTINVTEYTPCVVECPPEGVAEMETCGEEFNNGCNMAEPAFEMLEPGVPICGTITADESHRDTDWFEITVTESTAMTFTVTADFGDVSYLCGLVEPQVPGVVGCDQMTGYVDPVVIRTGCRTVSVDYNAVPGTYWFYISTRRFEDLPCDASNEYVAVLTCEPWYISGACCVDMVCEGTTTEAECDALGGIWYQDEDCKTYVCPEPVLCDDCEDACPITAPYPVSGSASTIGARLDCSHVFGDYGRGMWFEIELPYAENKVEVTYCPAGAGEDFHSPAGIEDIYSVAYVLMDDCACDDYIVCTGGDWWSYTCNGYQGFEMAFLPIQGPGTILLPVIVLNESYEGMEFDYTINVTEYVCDVECPAEGVPETESCGEFLNDGCNMIDSGFEAGFEPLECGVPVCGTSWAEDNMRDTDWFEVTVDDITTLTLTVTARFEGLRYYIGIIETAVPGAPECREIVGYQTVWGDECETVSLVYEAVPGTYWFWVTPASFFYLPCSDGGEYVATLTCEAQHGACCDDDTGTCTDDVAETDCPDPLRFKANASCEDLNPPCGGCLESTITIEIQTDDYPADITWEITDHDTGAVINSAGPYYDANTLYTERCCIGSTGDCYDFTIYDSYGDGLCCSHGNGYYNVYLDDVLQCTGGDFGDSETCERIGDCSEPTGACCDDEAGTCIEDVTESLCPSPMRWTEGTACADLAPPCGGCDESTLLIEIMTDDYPEETSWQITDQEQGTVICSGGPYSASLENELITEACCIGFADCVDFTLNDSWGDGISSPGGCRLTTDGIVLYDTIGNGWYGSSVTIEWIGDGCPVGACCVDDECVTTTGVYECSALGGALYEGEDCTTFVCPESAGNECGTPKHVGPLDTASLPFTDTNLTCGRGNEYEDTCLGYYAGGEDIVYELLVSEEMYVDILLDPGDTTWTGIAIDDTCPPGSSCLGYSTSSDAVRHGIEEITLAAGTYYIMIDTWSPPDCISEFTLTIREHVDCVLECPEGGIAESEPCGDDTNGGCYMETPVFEPVACNDVICGSIWAPANAQGDSDWFEYVATHDDTMTWTVEAEFGVLFGLVEQEIPGEPGCDNLTGYLNPYVQREHCVEDSVSFPVTAGGTYYLIVTHKDRDAISCGASNEYQATLTGLNCVPGDLDGDGDVDLQDLATLLANYGTDSGATYEDGDLDGDEDVDLQDLATLLGSYGYGT